MADPRNAPVIALHGFTAGAPLAERDDEALMLLAAGDRRDAFEVLVQRHLPRLAGYCAKFVGSAGIGEEIAQEILVETWRQRKRYRSSGRFPTFLFTLARNRCLNCIRDGRRRPSSFADAGGEGPAAPAGEAAPDQLDLLLEEERRREVWTALMALSEKLREAVLLRFDQGLEYPEIARIVGRPEATVRSRVHLAIRRLREELGEGSDA